MEMKWISSACSTNDICRCVVLQFASTNANAIEKHEVLYIKLEQIHRFHAAIVKDITKWDKTFCSSSRSRRVTRFKFGDNAYSVISLEREQDCI